MTKNDLKTAKRLMKYVTLSCRLLDRKPRILQDFIRP